MKRKQHTIIASSQAGFSLLEVMVFITILSLFFVSAASVVTFMLRNAKINEHKIRASRYAEEVMEWIRSERDIDWEQFVSHASASGTPEYCFNNANLVWDSSACTYTLDNVFRRTARLYSITSGGSVFQVNVTVNVEWDEAGKTYSVPINSTLSIWER